MDKSEYRGNYQKHNHSRTHAIRKTRSGFMDSVCGHHRVAPIEVMGAGNFDHVTQVTCGLCLNIMAARGWVRDTKPRPLALKDTKAMSEYEKSPDYFLVIDDNVVEVTKHDSEAEVIQHLEDTYDTSEMTNWGKSDITIVGVVEVSKFEPEAHYALKKMERRSFM